jgi:DNA-binding LacI/PurR family transcriptional regulator
MDLVLPVLAEAGLRVPEDMSIVWLSPTDRPETLARNPTRVHFDRAAVGEAAVRMLIQRLKGGYQGPQQLLLPCTFVVGTTTAPPRRTRTESRKAQFVS